MLLYGRQPIQPGSLHHLQQIAAEATALEENLDSWKQRMETLPGLHEAAAEKAAAVQERQAGYYNARRREAPFKCGDKVLTHILSSAAKGVAAKLAPKFAGP